MSSSHVCLFHDTHYASILQRIFNLLRKTVVKQQYDLNVLGKNSICTCPTSGHRVAGAVLPGFNREEVLKTIRSNFTQLDQPSEELEEVLRTKALLEFADQVAVDRLHQFICDMSDRALNAEKPPAKPDVTPPKPKRTKASIELPLRLDQLGHLMGRNGVNLKEIESETTTSIHVENTLYSESSDDQTPTFRLNSLHSFSSVLVTISGPSDQAVQNAVSALREKVAQVKTNLAQYSSTSNFTSTW